MTRDERGQTTVLIVGFAVVLMMAVAMVVNASAAYLQRQSLDNLADGAALMAADAGAEGDDVYAGGLDDDRLELLAAAARRAVDDYLAGTGAAGDFPGLTRSVRGRPGHPVGARADRRPAEAAAHHPRRAQDRHHRRHRSSRGDTRGLSPPGSGLVAHPEER